MKAQQTAYRWTGISLQGKKEQGICEAPHASAAKKSLRLQGIAYIKLSKNHRQNNLIKKISFKTNVIFYRQLATLILAGVSLTRSLEILQQNHTQTSLETLLGLLKHTIENGSNLSSAMQKLPTVFDTLTCHLIQVGEHSGTLAEMLVRIADHKEKSFHLKNKIKQALFYPAIVTGTAIIVALTLLIFVVPQFAELFNSCHSQLPRFTRQVIRVSECLCHFYYLALIPLSMSIIVKYLYQKYFIIKLSFDKLFLKIPLIGSLIKTFELARFTRTLAIMLSAGIPINEALKLLITSHRNAMFQQASKHWQTEIAAGQSLHKALQQPRLAPALVIQMIQVGEESGSLDQMLAKIATFYEREIDYTINHFSQLLEPLIIIILGVLIGGLVIAMYLPIFKLGTIL